MRILTWYVLAELLKVFTLVLVSLTSLMILIGLVKEARDQNLGLEPILQLLPYILPNALLFAVPGTILFAVSSVYGRMSNSNEILAIKSLGIHPWTILWPTFAFAIALSLVTVWLNDVAVSWGRQGVQRVVFESIEEIVYGMLRMQRSYSSPRFSISVRNVEDHRLIQPTISFFGGQDTPQVTITAAEAELSADLSEGVLKLVCRNGTVDVDGKGSLRFSDEFVHEVPLQDSSLKGDQSTLPAYMALRQIPAEIAKFEGKVAEFRNERSIKAALDLVTGDFTSVTGPEWSVDYQYLKSMNEGLHRRQTEPPRRWSNGFSCLCFAWIGSVMAIRRKNSDFLTSFFLCFLPILVVYYPLLMFGLGRCKDGALPPYSVWAANFMLLIWGAVLLKRVFRY